MADWARQVVAKVLISLNLPDRGLCCHLQNLGNKEIVGNPFRNRSQGAVLTDGCRVESLAACGGSVCAQCDCALSVCSVKVVRHKKLNSFCGELWKSLNSGTRGAFLASVAPGFETPTRKERERVGPPG